MYLRNKNPDGLRKSHPLFSQPSSLRTVENYQSHEPMEVMKESQTMENSNHYNEQEEDLSEEIRREEAEEEVPERKRNLLEMENNDFEVECEEQVHESSTEDIKKDFFAKNCQPKKEEVHMGSDSVSMESPNGHFDQDLLFNRQELAKQ